MTNRILGSTLLCALLLASAIPGCITEEVDPGFACCTGFKVGATIDANVSGSKQGQVAVQAVADVAAIASESVETLTTACRDIAQKLDAPKEGQDTAEAKADKRERLSEWCTLAVKTVGKVKEQGGGSIGVHVVLPTCEMSISAKASCQARCAPDGQCDAKANPPRCDGGNLQIACNGECTAKTGSALHCQGTCGASCKGECTAEGGTPCMGKCEGTCEGAGGAGTSGVDAHGDCQGSCKGTCKTTAPDVTCNGSCNGECTGSCKGSVRASVTCDGDCNADYEPITCRGGKLDGGCQVDANCDANCDASVAAKAKCVSPEVEVVVTSETELARKLEAALESNLPIVFASKARLDGMVASTTTLADNVGQLTDLRISCIPPVVAAAYDAVQDVTVSASVSAEIVGSAR